MGLKLKDWDRQAEKNNNNKERFSSVKNICDGRKGDRNRVSGNGVNSADEREPPYGWSWYW